MRKVKNCALAAACMLALGFALTSSKPAASYAQGKPITEVKVVNTPLPVTGVLNVGNVPTVNAQQSGPMLTSDQRS